RGREGIDAQRTSDLVVWLGRWKAVGGPLQEVPSAMQHTQPLVAVGIVMKDRPHDGLKRAISASVVPDGELGQQDVIGQQNAPLAHGESVVGLVVLLQVRWTPLPTGGLQWKLLTVLVEQRNRENGGDGVVVEMRLIPETGDIKPRRITWRPDQAVSAAHIPLVGPGQKTVHILRKRLRHVYSSIPRSAEISRQRAIHDQSTMASTAHRKPTVGLRSKPGETRSNTWCSFRGRGPLFMYHQLEVGW